MMKVLSVNAGSSSLKFQLIDMSNEELLAKGLIERIGLKNSVLTIDYLEEESEKNYTETQDIEDHQQAVELLFGLLDQLGIIKDYQEVKGVGHRVAAGGESFDDSTRITDEVIDEIESLNEYAPLHNPAQVAVIRAFRKILPDTIMVAVFDTSFHATVPEHNYLYSIPYAYYEDYKIRKYGFHGTSHRYVVNRAAEMMDQPIEDLKIITCHLGNGASITAVDGGKSVDTSMGFTPLAGITMGTRSGDVDPAILPFIMEKLEIEDVDEAIEILNKESGLLGISGVSSDMRELEEAAANGNVRAELAIEIFVNRIQKYIGSYIAEMNGVDAVVFTAGIGENSSSIREKIIAGITWFGLALDKEKNDTRKEAIISSETSNITVLNVPTNEEIEIARDVVRIAQNSEEGKEEKHEKTQK